MTPPTPLTIAYTEPLRAAWRRTRQILFRPFDPRTWLVLGFAAWLAGLMEGSVGGGGHFTIPKRCDLRSGAKSARDAWQHLLEHPWNTAFLVAAVITVTAVLLLLLWVSSRAKFVFLDNVVTRRAAIVEPWRRTRHLGTSLFLWRVGFFAVSLAATAVLAAFFFYAADGLEGLGFHTIRAAVISSLALLAFLFLFVAVAFVALCLDSFVVPLMARSQLSASAAWAAFLPWLEAYTGAFVVYALFVLTLWVGVSLAVVAAGFASCCMVFVLLAIPYVGTVALLPVHATYRLFSLAFLAQFDPGLDLAGLREELHLSA